MAIDKFLQHSITATQNDGIQTSKGLRLKYSYSIIKTHIQVDQHVVHCAKG